MDAELQKQIEEFQQEFAARSFVERHPELGRKVNCKICGQRHHARKFCKQTYAKLAPLKKRS